MLILIFGIAVIAMVTFIVLSCKKDPAKYLEWDSSSEVFSILATVVACIAFGILIAICSLAPTVATECAIDNKIAMYQEENAKIEQDIDKIVQEYLKNEHDTFPDLKTEESSITLVTLIPELKSDTHVEQQLHIYVFNIIMIETLRDEKIGFAKLKWILYFSR